MHDERREEVEERIDLYRREQPLLVGVAEFAAREAVLVRARRRDPARDAPVLSAGGAGRGRGARRRGAGGAVPSARTAAASARESSRGVVAARGVEARGVDLPLVDEVNVVEDVHRSVDEGEPRALALRVRRELPRLVRRHGALDVPRELLLHRDRRPGEVRARPRRAPASPAP